ncbi:hypothetical protein M8494_12745 [Serratia ureilytica]
MFFRINTAAAIMSAFTGNGNHPVAAHREEIASASSRLLAKPLHRRARVVTPKTIR